MLPVLNNFPLLFIYFVTNLIICEKTWSSGELPSSSLLSGRSIETSLLGVVQGEALAVQGHPHDQLGPGRALLNPVVYGVILEK